MVARDRDGMYSLVSAIAFDMQAPSPTPVKNRSAIST